MLDFHLTNSGVAILRLVISILDDCLGRGFGPSTRVICVEHRDSMSHNQGHRTRVRVVVEFFEAFDGPIGEFEGLIRIYSNSSKTFTEAEIQLFNLASKFSGYNGAKDFFFKYEIERNLKLNYKGMTFS